MRLSQTAICLFLLYLAGQCQAKLACLCSPSPTCVCPTRFQCGAVSYVFAMTTVPKECLSMLLPKKDRKGGLHPPQMSGKDIVTLMTLIGEERSRKAEESMPPSLIPPEIAHSKEQSLSALSSRVSDSLSICRIAEENGESKPVCESEPTDLASESLSEETSSKSATAPRSSGSKEEEMSDDNQTDEESTTRPSASRKSSRPSRLPPKAHRPHKRPSTSRHHRPSHSTAASRRPTSTRRSRPTSPAPQRPQKKPHHSKRPKHHRTRPPHHHSTHRPGPNVSGKPSDRNNRPESTTSVASDRKVRPESTTKKRKLSQKTTVTHSAVHKTTTRKPTTTVIPSSRPLEAQSKNVLIGVEEGETNIFPEPVAHATEKAGVSASTKGFRLQTAKLSPLERAWKQLKQIEAIENAIKAEDLDPSGNPNQLTDRLINNMMASLEIEEPEPNLNAFDFSDTEGTRRRMRSRAQVRLFNHLKALARARRLRLAAKTRERKTIRNERRL
ncbi:hypothetical protein AB6A40_000327 [Gnathostoma spinigerum]|uniref:Uncharacterized protein n=1 Tax=Gnathostoma spinigerum TaxID=75299 RepID=A0ABD6EA64_9BILA